MTVGRNEPCPCGSGKKYKKCCLAADEKKILPIVTPWRAKGAAEEARTPVALAAPPPREPKPVDPEREAIERALEERYARFKAADIEGKAEIFLRLVEGEGDPPMDREDVIDMLSTLNPLLARSNQRPRFDELVAALRAKLPEVYEDARLYILEWSAGNFAAQDRTDELAETVRDLAELVENDIDVLLRVMNMLDFHGRLPLLLEAVRIAWPHVKDSDNVVPWGISEFAQRAILYEIYDYLEQHPEASGGEEDLLARLLPYELHEPAKVATYMTNLRRPVPGATPLDLADFQLKPRKPKRKRDWDDDDEDDDAPAPEEAEAGPEQALFDLSITFLGWMHREKNVTFTRGRVGCKHLLEFLVQRAQGDLDDRRSMMERMMTPDRKPPPRQPIGNPLCPDRVRFDAYLGKMLAMMSWQFHPAAAMMHITPLWLEFLEINGLLAAEERRKAMQSLSELVEPVRKLIADPSNVDDPGLESALEIWAK